MAKLKKKTSEVKEHAEFSASGSARWLNCPGSHERSKAVPPLPESKYALEGTEAHACLEFLLKNRSELPAAILAASKKYPADMVEYALEAVEWVKKRFGEYGYTVKLLCETKVDASPFTCSDQFGTLDIGFVDEFGWLEIADFKYGAGIGVDPREENGELNSQLAYYALAVSHMYDHNFSGVRITVIQPRAFHESGETIRTAEATMDELLSWHDRFRQGVMETSDPKAPLKTGKWCKFCPVSINCPELKDKSFKDAQIVFSDTKGITNLPEVLTLPNLGVILDACDKLEAWTSRVREHAFHVLENGGEVEGWKLVEKRGTRKWVDKENVEAEAIELFGLKALSNPELLSPAQLEKKLKSTAGLADWVGDWIAKRVTCQSSGNTLVRSVDKRQAARSIDTIFSVIE